MCFRRSRRSIEIDPSISIDLFRYPDDPSRIDSPRSQPLTTPTTRDPAASAALIGAFTLTFHLNASRGQNGGARKPHATVHGNAATLRRVPTVPSSLSPQAERMRATRRLHAMGSHRQSRGIGLMKWSPPPSLSHEPLMKVHGWFLSAFSYSPLVFSASCRINWRLREQMSPYEWTSWAFGFPRGLHTLAEMSSSWEIDGTSVRIEEEGEED